MRLGSATDRRGEFLHIYFLDLPVGLALLLLSYRIDILGRISLLLTNTLKYLFFYDKTPQLLIIVFDNAKIWQNLSIK